ncbi:MAG: PAS domain S-box protein [Ruminococcus sp.]|nr:PAS domain S-box protein [Ruminococcus sp.]MDE7226038.1 PAS domain S-box protein [Ruminococcus sp.]
MTRKIFFGIFITSVISSIVTAGFILWTVCGSDGKKWQEFAENAGFTAEIFLILVLIISAVSISVSKRIVKPLKNIDPENPKIERVYREIIPVLKRLKVQNGKVNRYKTELNSSEVVFSTILESVKDGIIIADPKTVVLSCNTEAYRLLGAEHLNSGQSIYNLSNDEPFRHCIMNAMGGRRSECILKTIMGDRKVIASPASISDTLNGIVVFIMDVTEEQALEKMRREFTSNVSHELKTPLTTIYGIADMLANGIVKSEDTVQFGGDIRNEAERLITLINDIVSLSKLDEGVTLYPDKEVDIYDIAESVMNRLKNSANQKNVSQILEGEHIKIKGNPTILEEILYNLCDNAIKYNNDGGKYIVRVSHIPMKAIITVSDTGIGISENHIDRIFERFYRADKSRSQKIKGTGLGLSIVKHGVMYHNGTVRAVSSEKGSVFIIEFPL